MKTKQKYIVNSYRGLNSLENRLNHLIDGEKIISMFSGHNGEFILVTLIEEEISDDYEEQLDDMEGD